MKTVDFFGHIVTRLIVGGNPFAGFSYVSNISRDEMMDYYTAENMLSCLRRAEELGYTAFIATTDSFTNRTYRQYRNKGGKLKWIAQTYIPHNMQVNVNIAIESGAIAIFQQGTEGDGYFETGQLDALRANITEMRRAGIPVGLATHVPAFMELAEQELDYDFYMACVHNMRRDNEGRVSSSISGKKNESHTFVYEDRAEMFKAIRAVDKPCIAYKILAGGNYANTEEDLLRCLVETYQNIKPTDTATIGVFQRDRDELTINARVLDEALARINHK